MVRLFTGVILAHTDFQATGYKSGLQVLKKC
jgi:hypothetical protein